MAEPNPNCEDCLEITRSQRECINCGIPTRYRVVEIPNAVGGPGNAGPGPHAGWDCVACHALWDGGATYDFACEKHGGLTDQEAKARAAKVSKSIDTGTPIGKYADALHPSERDVLLQVVGRPLSTSGGLRRSTVRRTKRLYLKLKRRPRGDAMRELVERWETDRAKAGSEFEVPEEWKRAV